MIRDASADPRLDEDVAAMLKQRGPTADYVDGDLQKLRALITSRTSSDGPEMLGGVEDQLLLGPHGELMVRVYRPKVREDTLSPAFLFMHGGGMVLGSVDSFDGMARRIAAASGAVVVSVDYRLAPEFAPPVASEEVQFALHWLVDHAASLGVDPKCIAVGGDSAGGTLATAVALYWRDQKATPPLSALVLMYPGLDEGFDYPSAHEFAEGYGLSLRNARWMRSQYIGAASVDASPYLLPSRASDLSGLPRTLLITAELDLIRDGAEHFGRRLIDARVPVTMSRYPGVLHGFLSQGVRRSAQAFAEIGAFLQTSWNDDLSE